MKDRLTLLSLASKSFNSLGDENDEYIYTYTDPFMRNFVRQNSKGGRCSVLKHFFKSIISDNLYDNISQ